MRVTITFLINASVCNGSLGIDIFDQDQLVYSRRDFAAGPDKIEFTVNWPTTLDIITSNRHPGDTENNSNGVVIANKAVEITGILINEFPLHVDKLDKLFNCQRDTNSELTHENFWDFNGKIQMHLTHNSPMRFMLSLQNQFDGNRLTWNNND